MTGFCSSTADSWPTTTYIKYIQIYIISYTFFPFMTPVLIGFGPSFGGLKHQNPGRYIIYNLTYAIHKQNIYPHSTYHVHISPGSPFPNKFYRRSWTSDPKSWKGGGHAVMGYRDIYIYTRIIYIYIWYPSIKNDGSKLSKPWSTWGMYGSCWDMEGKKSQINLWWEIIWH